MTTKDGYVVLCYLVNNLLQKHILYQNGTYQSSHHGHVFVFGKPLRENPWNESETEIIEMFQNHGTELMNRSGFANHFGMLVTNTNITVFSK